MLHGKKYQAIDPIDPSWMRPIDPIAYLLHEGNTYQVIDPINLSHAWR